MASYKSLFLLSGLVFGSAQALNPSNTHPTTTFATSVKVASQTSFIKHAGLRLRSDDHWTCVAGYTEDGTLCNQKGTYEKNIPFLDSLPISFEECVNTCRNNHDCEFFYYEDNLCQTFGEEIASLNFQNGDSKGSYFDRSCFACVNFEEKPLDLNFEDANVDNWILNRPNDDAFFMDTIQTRAAYDGSTTVLRLLEAQDSGTSRLEYPGIQLTAGNYRFGFVGKNTVQRTASTGTQWSNVNIEVSGEYGDVYDAPVQGISLDPSGYSGWTSFMMDFVVPEDTTATVAISVAASGFLIDWFFDDMYLGKMY